MIDGLISGTSVFSADFDMHSSAFDFGFGFRLARVFPHWRFFGEFADMTGLADGNPRLNFAPAVQATQFAHLLFGFHELNPFFEDPFVEHPLRDIDILHHLEHRGIPVGTKIGLGNLDEPLFFLMTCRTTIQSGFVEQCPASRTVG